MELEKNWKKHESVIVLAPNAVGFFTEPRRKAPAFRHGDIRREVAVAFSFA